LVFAGEIAQQARPSEIAMTRRAILRLNPSQAWLFGAVMLALPPAAVACGYHDDVSLARGVLNWTYPDALHVVGAMAQAVSERRLPPPTFGREHDAWGYHRVVRLLDQYAQRMRLVRSEARPPAFSLLLIEPMLWTRFASEGGELQFQVHVSGPQAGDLVLISGETVIREITNSRLLVGEAYRLGLMRLYGTEEQVLKFLALYD
jgi:hypothetical protein